MTTRIRWGFWTTRTVDCPDGSVKEVFRNPDRAFPLIAKDWSARFKAAVKALEGVQGSLGVELKSQVAGVFFLLTKTNGTMQMKLHAIYVVYMGDPCKWDDWMKGEVQKVIDTESDLRKIELAIERLRSSPPTSLQTSGDQVRRIVEELTESVSGSEFQEEIVEAFEAADKDAKSWSENP
jgi:hypothetical protein